MASIRRGYSDDFTLKNSGVGINTTEPQQKVDVVGVVKGQDLYATGVSSLTAYEGFLRADQQIAENTTLSFDQGPVSSLSGEIIVGTGKTVTVNEVVKETAGVGNGSNDQWFDINGNYAFKTNGDPTWDGSAFVYDGTGDYHSLSGGDTSTFEVGSSNFTLEQWVYITATSSICSTFFSKGNNNSVGTDFMSLQTTGANTTPAFFFRSGSVLMTASSVGTGGWHHYVVTRSGSNFTFYVDGTSVDTATNSDSLASGITGGINIGAQSYSVSTDGRKLNGKISITRLYSGTVLTAAQVTSNYNAGYTATTSAVAATVDLNANVPSSYPGTVRDVDTTDFTRAGGSEIECLKVYNTFTPPSGGTNERPYKPKPGQLYYNYDFKTIEFFDGNGWRQVDNTTRSGRVVIAGGYTDFPSAYTTIGDIQFLQVMTLGNTQYFGQLNEINTEHIGCGSEIRGILGGGYVGARVNIMQYVTIASASNAIDFGNLTQVRNQAQAVSSSTRGIWGGGFSSGASDVIDYVEISTLGDAIDFGDLTVAKSTGAVGNSPTRGVFISGYRQPQVVDYHKTEYITISSKGNGTDFGESGIIIAGGSCGSNTRGVFGGGYQRNPATSPIKTLSYVTMASFGNTVDFGNLTVDMTYASAGGNSVRGVFTGSDGAPHTSTNIDYVSVTSLGNGQDFGDLSIRTGYAGAVSDSHGGLGGF